MESGEWNVGQRWVSKSNPHWGVGVVRYVENGYAVIRWANGCVASFRQEARRGMLATILRTDRERRLHQ